MKVAIAVLMLVAVVGSQTINFNDLVSSGTGHRGTLTEATKQTPAEIAKLKSAREQFEKARQALNAAESEVKHAHGDLQFCNFQSAECAGGTDVVLEGDFVLVYKWASPINHLIW